MADLFQFEEDFADSLHCIPMAVRFKLDSCGVKLKLTHWNQFSTEERLSLLSTEADSPADCDRYRDFLQALVTEKTGEPAKALPIDPLPPWEIYDRIPESVQSKAESVNIHLKLEQWQGLSVLQRFALIKLSQASHETRNFLPALKEFSLIL